MQDTQNLLSIVRLKKYFPVKNSIFPSRRKYLHANESVSFDIRRGETFALVGESGSGKSTLGRTLLQLYRPTAGEVHYFQENGKSVDLAKLSEKQMRLLRNELQIVFQDPYSSLNPRMTVGQIIEEGVATHKFYKRGTPQMREYVFSVMEKCGWQPYMSARYPHEFSGGQRQRVCIARALAVKPKFVVCDECVSALDVSIQSQILNLLSDLKEKEKLTYLFISHDLSVVRHISDRIGVMYLGQIVELGENKRIFSNPRHPYTIALMSAAPTLGNTGKGKDKIILEGNMPNPVSPPTACRFHTRCFMAQDVCRQIPAPLVEVENGHFVACHFAGKPTLEKRKIAKERSRANDGQHQKKESGA